MEAHELLGWVELLPRLPVERRGLDRRGRGMPQTQQHLFRGAARGHLHRGRDLAVVHVGDDLVVHRAEMRGGVLHADLLALPEFLFLNGWCKEISKIETIESEPTNKYLLCNLISNKL